MRLLPIDYHVPLELVLGYYIIILLVIDYSSLRIISNLDLYIIII